MQAIADAYIHLCVRPKATVLHALNELSPALVLNFIDFWSKVKFIHARCTFCNIKLI